MTRQPVLNMRKMWWWQKDKVIPFGLAAVQHLPTTATATATVTFHTCSSIPLPSACYRATHGAKARGSDSSMDGLVGWSTSKHLRHKQRGGEHAHARKTETTHNMHTHERTCTGRGSATWCARTIASKCTGPQARKQGDLRAKRETPLQKLVLCEKEERCACKWVPCGAHNDIVIHVTSACQPEADEQGTQNRAGEKMKR